MVTEPSDEEPSLVGTLDSISLVSARQFEYERAGQQWFHEKVRQVSPALDQLYGQFNFQTTRAVADSVVNISDDRQIDLPVHVQRALIDTNVQALIDGDLEDLHENVVNMAQQHVQDTISMFVQTMDTVTAATGQVLESTGDINEDIISMWETMSVEFDDDGKPTTSLVVHPDVVPKLRAAEAAMTSEQARRFEDVMDKKRREFFASRRTRRLPRHGN